MRLEAGGMSTVFWVLVAVLLVIIAVAVAFLLIPSATQRRRLRERFGPEYDRAVVEAGDRRSAERRLATTAKRRESLDIRPLSERERQSFVARWDEIQSDFVDRPASATDRAEMMIIDVMRSRGYPIEHFEARTDLLAADFPQVVENYREAHALRKRNREPGADTDTEELRTALVRYRALFERLLGADATNDSGYADLGSDGSASRESDGRRADDGRRTESDVRPEVLRSTARGRSDRSHSG
jgi:hypothetical protein